MRHIILALCLLLGGLGAPSNAQTIIGSSPVGTVVTSAIASGSAVTLTNNTAANVTSVGMTPGTWICGGGINFLAGTVAPTLLQGGFTTTTGHAPNIDGQFFMDFAASTLAITGQSMGIGMTVQTVTVNTTLFMTAVVGFASGTAWKAYGTESCVRIQ